MGAGHLCHGEEGVRYVREEGVQIEMLPAPTVFLLIPKQHGHYVAEELVAPFLRWPPDILILHEVEQRSRVDAFHGWGPCLAPWLLPQQLPSSL